MVPSLFWTQSSGKDLISGNGGREIRAVLDGYFRYGGSGVNPYALPPDLYFALESGLIPINSGMDISPKAKTVFWRGNSDTDNPILEINTFTDFAEAMSTLGYSQCSLEDAVQRKKKLYTSYSAMYGSAGAFNRLQELDPTKVLCYFSKFNVELLDSKFVHDKRQLRHPNLVCVQVLNDSLEAISVTEAAKASFIKIVLSAVTLQKEFVPLAINGKVAADYSYMDSKFVDAGDGAAKVEDTHTILPYCWRSECDDNRGSGFLSRWMDKAADDIEAVREKSNQTILKAASFLANIYKIDVGDDATSYIGGGNIKEKIDKLSAKIAHYSELMKQVSTGELSIANTGFSLASNRDEFLTSLGDNIYEYYYSLLKDGSGKGLPTMYTKFRGLQTLNGFKKSYPFEVPETGKLFLVKHEDATAVWFIPDSKDNPKVKNPTGRGGIFILDTPAGYDWSKVTYTVKSTSSKLVEVDLNSKSGASNAYVDFTETTREVLSKIEGTKFEAGTVITFHDLSAISDEQVKRKNEFAESLAGNIQLAGFLFLKRLNSCGQELVYQFARYRCELKSFIDKVKSTESPSAPRLDNVMYVITNDNYDLGSESINKSAYGVWMNVDNSFLDSFTSILTAYKGSSGMGKNGSNQYLLSTIKDRNDRTQKVAYAPSLSSVYTVGEDGKRKRIASFAYDELLYRDYMQYMTGNFMYAPFGSAVVRKAAKLIYTWLSKRLGETLVLKEIPESVDLLGIQSVTNSSLSNISRSDDVQAENQGTLWEACSNLSEEINRGKVDKPCHIGVFCMPDRSYYFVGHKYVSYKTPATKFANKPLCLPYWCVYTSRRTGGRSTPIPQYIFSLIENASDPFDGLISFGGCFATVWLKGEKHYVSYSSVVEGASTIEDFALYLFDK